MRDQQPRGQTANLVCGEDHVAYNKASIEYKTFDADASQILRLASQPTSITAAGAALSPVDDLKQEGFQVRALANGDVILRIHHRGGKDVKISWQ